MLMNHEIDEAMPLDSRGTAPVTGNPFWDRLCGGIVALLIPCVLGLTFVSMYPVFRSAVAGAGAMWLCLLMGLGVVLSPFILERRVARTYPELARGMRFGNRLFGIVFLGTSAVWPFWLGAALLSQ
jgi:hypothetical protein